MRSSKHDEAGRGAKQAANRQDASEAAGGAIPCCLRSETSVVALQTQLTHAPRRLFAHSASEDIVEEAWNSTLLQKRYAASVATIDFHFSVGDGVPRLALIDAGRAKQVVANVVGNAIKARGWWWRAAR